MALDKTKFARQLTALGLLSLTAMFDLPHRHHGLVQDRVYLGFCSDYHVNLV
jgi:hypothetical protein